MPWSKRKYGRAICNSCGWASKRNDLTGYKDLLTICGYLKRKVHPEPIWCPQCVLTQEDAAGGLVVLTMTEEKAQAQRALHWLPNEDLAEAQDAAELDAGRGQLGAADRVDADEGDMEKAVMLQRIQRLESTEELLSDRVSNLEAKLQEVMDRLELLQGVAMGAPPAGALLM